MVEEEGFNGAFKEKRNDFFIMPSQPPCSNQAFFNTLPLFIGSEHANPIFQFLPVNWRWERLTLRSITESARCAIGSHHQWDEPIFRLVHMRDLYAVHHHCQFCATLECSSICRDMSSHVLHHQFQRFFFRNTFR